MATSMTITFLVFSLAATLSFAADLSLRSRELTQSATLKDCFLINIDTLSEEKLKENDSFTLDKKNDKGYSIRCDIRSAGRLSEIKFSYDDKVHVESRAPYFMFGGKPSRSIINAVDYLSTCGSKVVKVQGFLHNKLSFEKNFNIKVKNPSGVSCDSEGPTDGSCPAQVTGFTLVDAKRATDIMPLRSYSLNDVPKSLNIRVNVRECSAKVVRSVFIDFDGEKRCESSAPYTLFGDVRSKGKYNGKSISGGRHTIKATPYTKDKCRGDAGKTRTLKFTVEEDAVLDNDDEHY